MRSPPFTLDIDGSPDILSYTVIIRNSMGAVLLSINSTNNELYYTSNELTSCQHGTLEINVAAWNRIGIGLYSEPVEIYGIAIVWEGVDGYKLCMLLYSYCTANLQ